VVNGSGPFGRFAGDVVIGAGERAFRVHRTYGNLVVGQVEYASAPERLTKVLASHPVPIMPLAYLAIATSWLGKGLGAGLLKDAMQRTLQAADIAGIGALAVHAKDDAATSFTNISASVRCRAIQIIYSACSMIFATTADPGSLLE
jgi:hypothetical protein